MPGKKEGLTERLADYALSLQYEDLPPPVVERVKGLFLDYLGVACGGRAVADSSPPILQAVRDLCGGQEGPSTVVAERETYPPHYAALLNGTFAHSMDFDDTHRESVMHPGTPVFSALLALGEQVHASGREFLTAAVAGYEVSCRLGKAHGEGVHHRGFHPTATTGLFGATAAGARLLGLSREALLNAWGVNLSQSAGSLQFLENGAWNKRFHTGMSAHHAIVALALARHGVRGAADPFEGRFGYYRLYCEGPYDLASALSDLGRDYELLKTAVKPYPCCRYNHSVIDAVLSLVRERGLRSEEVAEMEIALNRTGFSIVGEPEASKKDPRNVVEGQFSVYFASAVALLEGSFTWDSYRRLGDPQVREVMARTRAQGASIPDLGARVVITTRRGERLVREVPLAKGEPENFVTWEELEGKARSLARLALPEEKVEGMVETVSRLEEVPDLTLLTRHLRP